MQKPIIVHLFLNAFVLFLCIFASCPGIATAAPPESDIDLGTSVKTSNQSGFESDSEAGSKSGADPESGENHDAEPQILKVQIGKSHVKEVTQKCKNPEFYNNSTDYVLGPNDSIRLSILDYPELTQDHLRVQPDGKLILDALDEPMSVEGMTMTQLYCELTAAYARILHDPRLTIDLIETKPFMVYITGSVLNPGSYEVMTQSFRNPPQNLPEITINRTSPALSNVLVAAGGVAYNADLTQIRVENKRTGKSRTINLIALLKDGDIEQDVRLVQGDQIYVPKANTAINEADYRLYANSSFSPKTIPVKVIGYVNRPGLVKLQSAQSLNLMSAISEAGGYQSNAAYAPKHIHVFRVLDEEGHLSRFEVNPKLQDVTLFPNDIVYVPLPKAPRAGLLFDYISRMLNPFVRSAATYRGFTGDVLF